MRHRSGYFLGALVFIATIALFGLAVMFLWNELLPGIFGLPVINYWQAAGLLVLARIIFGGIDGGISHALVHRNPFRDKWHGMSKPEREDFLKKHHHGFHSHHDTGGANAVKDSGIKKE